MHCDLRSFYSPYTYTRYEFEEEAGGMSEATESVQKDLGKEQELGTRVEDQNPASSDMLLIVKERRR
jgi:hypothetical protein